MGCLTYSIHKFIIAHFFKRARMSDVVETMVSITSWPRNWLSIVIASMNVKVIILKGFKP